MLRFSTNKTKRVILMEEAQGNGNKLLLHAAYLSQNSEYHGFHQLNEADPEPKLAQDGTKTPSNCFLCPNTSSKGNALLVPSWIRAWHHTALYLTHFEHTFPAPSGFQKSQSQGHIDFSTSTITFLNSNSQTNNYKHTTYSRWCQSHCARTSSLVLLDVLLILIEMLSSIVAI